MASVWLRSILKQGRFTVLNSAQLRSAFKFFNRNHAPTLSHDELSDGIMQLQPYMRHDMAASLLSAYGNLDLKYFKHCFFQQAKDALASGRAYFAVHDLQDTR